MSTESKSSDILTFPVASWRRSLGLRFIEHNDRCSGQQFRAEVVHPLFEYAKKNGKVVLFDFTGIVGGCPPSFANEAFGGLHSRDGIDKADLKKVLSFKGFDKVMLSNIEYQVFDKSETFHPSSRRVTSEDTLQLLKNTPGYEPFDWESALK